MNRTTWIAFRVKATAVVAASAFLVAGCASDKDTTTNTTADTTAGTTPDSLETTTSVAMSSEDIDARPSKGCATALTAADQAKTEIKVGDKARWWLLTAPATEANGTPTPLVVDFHGLLEGALVHSEMSGLSKFSPANGFAVATPDGFGTPIHWEVGLDKATNYDLQFVDAMLEKLFATRCIDTARVYATGLSNGAFMSSTLACSHADVFAAVAPVAGAQASPDCKPARAVPVIAFHGSADQILKYNGGFGGIPGMTPGATDPLTTPAPTVDVNGEGYPADIKRWAERNGCDPAPKDTETKTGETTTPSYLHRVYTCPSGADVEFYTVFGAGHTWPGSAFSNNLGKVMGPTSMKINANELIWEFFKKHALPA